MAIYRAITPKGSTGSRVSVSLGNHSSFAWIIQEDKILFKQNLVHQLIYIPGPQMTRLFSLEFRPSFEGLTFKIEVKIGFRVCIHMYVNMPHTFDGFIRNSHTTPIRIPKDMGIVWETYHKGFPCPWGSLKVPLIPVVAAIFSSMRQGKVWTTRISMLPLLVPSVVPITCAQ